MDIQYLELVKDILDNGDERKDRTGVGTKAVFGRQLRHDLKSGFPLLTTKKVSFKGIAAELLWFLEGSNDERRLAEILHGTRDQSKTTIWTANATADYWKDRSQFPGDLGRIYGVQWRNWRSVKIDRSEETIEHIDGAVTLLDAKVTVTYIDQVQKVIDTIKSNPTDRRMIISAYNVGELDNMALPPCHIFCQFFVNTNKNELSCQVYMRSVDVGLGLPYNIASYALLTHMIARVTGLGVGELIMNLGDTHIYLDHIDALKEQLTRTPHALPTLTIDTVSSIDDFKLNSFKINNYTSHNTVKMAMAV